MIRCESLAIERARHTTEPRAAAVAVADGQRLDTHTGQARGAQDETNKQRI